MSDRTRQHGMPTRLAAAALMRGYLVFFLPWAFAVLHPGSKPLRMFWYLRAMCQAFQRAGTGQVRRLVINLPPRNLKSVTSVAFTAWMLGRNPALKIMMVTYGAKLSSEHVENCRRLMSHSFYRALFPATQLVMGGKGELVIRTTAGGGCRSVTVGGATTGFGADLILIDDAMKAEDITSEARREELDRFYRTTLVTRLNNKRRGTIISVQQRLGEDDLPARLIDAGAEHLSLPAYGDHEVVYDIGFGRQYRRPPGEVLRPDDEPREVLEQYRREMGPRDFATQYLQEPSAADGNLLRWEWFGSYDEAPERHELLKVVQSWDTGASEAPNSDFSVCTTWGFDRTKCAWLLLDVFRERLAYPDLKRAVERLARRWKTDRVLIEDAGTGKSLWQEFRASGKLRPVMIRPVGSKEERFTGGFAEIEAGNILLPEEAPWLEAFRRELKAFPTGGHDDQVDSVSQFVEFQLKNWKWTLTEHDRNGRPLRINRERVRPW